MRLAVRFVDGLLRPAILMMRMGDRIRVAIPCFDDAVEFRLADGCWFDEAGTMVEIRFDLPDWDFANLVQESAATCRDRSDALEIQLWSLCVPKRSYAVRVN